MSVSGTYTVTYSATDADGNIGTASRTVIVDDTIAPVITLDNGDIGTTNYTVERGTTYVDPGATTDGGETVTVDTSELNMAVSGNYIVTYSATDADGNIGTASRTVIVEDNDAPVITLSGTNPYTVERGTTYEDPGATADTGETVVVNTSQLNMAVSGTYTVTYSATDADGNTGTASRTVTVDDVPVITLVGSDPFYHENGDVYVDLGATADGGETIAINNSDVNNSVDGTYTVYYTTTNSILVGTATRTVKVDSYPVNLYTSAFNYGIQATAISSDGSVFVEVTNASDSKAYYSNGTQKGGNLTSLSSGVGTYCDISGDGNRIVKSARVFDWNGSTWSDTYLGVPSTPAGLSPYYLGWVTAISDDGNRVLVADYQGTFNTSRDCGFVYIAVYNGSSWSTQQVIMGAAYVYLGYSADLSGDGNTIVMSNLSSSGFIATWRRTTGNYSHVNTSYTSFRIESLSLSYDGNVLAVIMGSNLRVYEWNIGSWLEIGSGITATAYSTAKLSSDGQRVVLGEKYYDNLNGRIRLYERNGTNWVLINTIIGSTSTAYPKYGETVSINGNGDRIAFNGDFEMKVEQQRSRST
jgi:hypothetical protein